MGRHLFLHRAQVGCMRVHLVPYLLDTQLGMIDFIFLLIPRAAIVILAIALVSMWLLLIRVVVDRYLNATAGAALF